MGSKLERAMVNTLLSKKAYGESRHQAKLEGTANEKVFSYGTMNKYVQVTKDFCRFCESQEKGLRYTKDVIKYVNPYLQSLKDKGMSGWTQQTHRSALSKLFGKDYCTIELDQKKRCDIKRSRFDVPNARHFSVKNNEELINFCQHTGLRRTELESLKPEQLFYKNGQAFLKVKGKGGKVRDALILENDQRVIDRINNTKKNELVWGKVHSAANIHGYRGDYAKSLYQSVSRPLEDLNRNEIYYCRGDKRGDRYDKKAMLEVSRSLGHNRIDVIANNYLY